jgi:hypothetical protein
MARKATVGCFAATTTRQAQEYTQSLVKWAIRVLSFEQTAPRLRICEAMSVLRHIFSWRGSWLKIGITGKFDSTNSQKRSPWPHDFSHTGILDSYISLSIYSPFLDLGRFFIFLILYTVGRTIWTGDQPVARLLPTNRTTQTQNKSTQTPIPRVGFKPTMPPFERAKKVHALDRVATVIGGFEDSQHIYVYPHLSVLFCVAF